MMSSKQIKMFKKGQIYTYTISYILPPTDRLVPTIVVLARKHLEHSYTAVPKAIRDLIVSIPLV